MTVSAASTSRGQALAAVTDSDGTRVESFAWGGHGRDDGWLRVEASGVCGTDVSLAANGLPRPTVLGHHVVGRIEAVGPDAVQRWGVDVGDQVAVEEYLPCGRCRSCRAGMYRLCPDTDLWDRGRRVGLVPVEEKPSLWGGNAQYMYLPPNAVVHVLPPDLPIEAAVWVQPLGNALDWVGRVGDLRSQETLVVLGPGYHGLAAVAAASALGAGKVLVGGRQSDAARLEIAERLGAITFDVDTPDLPEQIRHLSGGLADVVLDVAGADPTSTSVALSLLRPRGRLVVAGIKDPADVSLDSTQLVRSMVTIVGVRGRNPESIRASIELLDAGTDLGEVPTHEVSLTEVESLLAQLAEGRGPATPHVVVRPWGPGEATRATPRWRRNDEQASSLV